MDNKGFTLIEVLAYIVIVGIAYTIAVPSLGVLYEASFNADARGLVYDIRYTKDLTLNNGENYKILFSKDGYEIRGPMGVVKSYKFQRGARLEDYELNVGSRKVNYMEYTQEGRASASGTLILTNSDNTSKKRISITPVTGRVALVED